MTTQERIEAILAEGTIIPVSDLPPVRYVGGSEDRGVPAGIAGSVGGTVFFDVDALKNMDDDKLAFVVRHELMHAKYARLTLDAPRETIATVDAGWLATLKVSLDEGVIVPAQPTDDWVSLLKHVVDAAIAPKQPTRGD